MIPYKSKSGKHGGVTGYAIGEDFIEVEFNHAKRYRYPYSLNSEETIEKMKALAIQQKGLSTFISQHNPIYDQVIDV